MEQLAKNSLAISQKFTWRKKFFKSCDYNEWYKYHSSYCLLKTEKNGKVTAGYWLAFPCVLPDKDCLHLDNEEFMITDAYFRSHNIRPFVTSEESNFGRVKIDDKYISNENELKELVDANEEIDVNQLTF